MLLDDTIAAISSPPGPAMRGILRLSGPDAWPAAAALLHPGLSQRAGILRTSLRRWPLPVLLLRFRGPRSFTGQDIAELHLPGSPPLLDMLLADLLRAGARQAGPGEFSARAFLLGKIDLTQAEGIAATIAAEDSQQLRAAAALRSGRLFAWCSAISDRLAGLLALVEVSIDFSDEPELLAVEPTEFLAGVGDVATRIEVLRQHALGWHGATAAPLAVLCGPTNAGKSSLLNALCAMQRVIVSDTPGATRDAVEAMLAGAGPAVRIADTAGYEHADHPLASAMRTARERALMQADLAVLVVDNRQSAEEVSRIRAEVLRQVSGPLLLVRNKADLPGHGDAPVDAAVSALTGEGIQDLAQRIRQGVLRQGTVGEQAITLNRRHTAALEAAASALAGCSEQLRQGALAAAPELVALHLRAALDAIGEIAGQVSADAILGKIFSSFCIGK